MEDLNVNMQKRGAIYELLLDPFNDRQIKDVPLPPCKPIRDKILFKKNDEIPNYDILKQFLREEG
jgi:hypothetical protein